MYAVLAGNTEKEKYENALVAIKALSNLQATGEYNGSKLTDSQKEWLGEEIGKLEKYVENTGNVISRIISVIISSKLSIGKATP